MSAIDQLKQLRLQKDKISENDKEKRVKDATDYGGRKVILILFFLTLLLSLFFWFQGQFSDWLRNFFGPSTWTFSR